MPDAMQSWKKSVKKSPERPAVIQAVAMIRAIIVAAFILAYTALSPAAGSQPQTPVTSFFAQQRINQAVAHSAERQRGETVFYDPAYVNLAYPGGDVPAERGVCSDVVIRALRSQNVDLQQLVHEDMLAHFSAYPQQWKLTRPDANIDHRRVPNLETWFSRHGKALAVTQQAADYLPGDIVSWRLNNGLAHIGIVSDHYSRQGVPLIIHNIGAGVQLEDVLFNWRIIGHYRYFQ